MGDEENKYELNPTLPTKKLPSGRVVFDKPAVAFTGKNTNARSNIARVHMHKMAMLMLSGITDNNHIASRLGMTTRATKVLSQSAEFCEVFDQVQNEFFGKISTVIADERADFVQRQRAMGIRAQTMLGEIVEEIRTRVSKGKKMIDVRGREFNIPADPADLRSGIAAAKLIFERDPLQQKSGAEGSGTQVSVNVFMPDGRQAAVIRDTYQETGIPMEDVLDADYELSPDNPKSADASGE